MEKIALCIILAILSQMFVVYAIVPSIESVWMEKDPLNANSYLFWIEVLNEDGVTPSPDEVLVTFESKYDSFAMSWDEWKSGGRLGSFYYYNEQGTDYSKQYFKIQHGFLEEEIRNGLKIDYRITAKQGSNTTTKEVSFTIGGGPDLSIENTEIEPTIVDEFGGYHLPALKFTLTIKNKGKKDAILRDSLGTVGVFLKVNENNFGWGPIIEIGSAKNTTVLKPNESMKFVFNYWEQYHFSNMKIGNNTFSFYVDNTYGNYSSSYSGKIKESDETNNKYDYVYDAQACKDNEKDKSSNFKGTIELYSAKLDDECDGKNVREYWCYSDFHVGYSSDACSEKCVKGKCTSPSFIQKIIEWFKKLFGG